MGNKLHLGKAVAVERRKKTGGRFYRGTEKVGMGVPGAVREQESPIETHTKSAHAGTQVPMYSSI